MMRRSFLGMLAVGLLIFGGGTTCVQMAQAVSMRVARGHVVLQIDGRMISMTLTPAQAVADARQFVTFAPHLPTRVPPGVTLQNVSITTFGGSPMFASISLDFAGAGRRAFSLREGKLHLSTRMGGGGVTTTVKIGKVAGQLVEIKKAGTHQFALSWFSGIGYDLHTIGAATSLTQKDLLAIARAL